MHDKTTDIKPSITNIKACNISYKCVKPKLQVHHLAIFYISVLNITLSSPRYNSPSITHSEQYQKEVIKRKKTGTAITNGNPVEMILGQLIPYIVG